MKQFKLSSRAVSFLLLIAVILGIFTVRLYQLQVTEAVDHKEMFMAYCFGPLYVLMGISYLTGH